MTKYSIDDECSRYFKFSDLFHVGQTWALRKVENVPKQIETWESFSKLATQILDPVVKNFGLIQITYGFSSPDLYRYIKKSISPNRDQHAGGEINNSGQPICNRGGAAVDFYCPTTVSSAVAIWIAENAEFDRMYFYGSDKPLHVSIGNKPNRLIYSMYASRYSGLRVPRRINYTNLKHLKDVLI